MPATDLYHGTRLDFAKAMVGPPKTIEVTRGSGEFGTGFYCGVSMPFAMSFVLNRYKNPALLHVHLEERAYEALKVRELDDDAAARHRKEARRERGHCLFGHDVLVGPIEGSSKRIQYKFETRAAQDVLNGPLSRLTTIG
jgi:hypothetical protein